MLFRKDLRQPWTTELQRKRRWNFRGTSPSKISPAQPQCAIMAAGPGGPRWEQEPAAPAVALGKRFPSLPATAISRGPVEFHPAAGPQLPGESHSSGLKSPSSVKGKIARASLSSFRSLRQMLRNPVCFSPAETRGHLTRFHHLHKIIFECTSLTREL